MRQTVRRGVALLNTNPKWWEDCVAVLQEVGRRKRRSLS